jgi:ABC-type Zn uptake system ZnuABC Zn-binding protein ZnuA
VHIESKSTFVFRKALHCILIGALFLVGAPFLVGALGRPERPPAHREAGIPHIEPVKLVAGERLSVIASTSIVGDVVENVGGEAIDLTVVIGFGQDPHSYAPTPRALKTVEDAHLVFVNGLGLEEGLMDAVESLASVPVIAVSTGIEPMVFQSRHGHEGIEEAHDAHGGGDPHFWMNPANVMVWVENIERALSQADPARRAVYEANARAYIAKLEKLDAEIRRLIEAIPKRKRKLVVDHHVLSYFADEYGFEVIGALLGSISTSSDASAGETAKLVELLREQQVATIFVGSTAGQGLQRLADAVAGELGREVTILPIMTGSLAPPGQRGDTYLDYMEYNVSQIVSGLTR